MKIIFGMAILFLCSFCESQKEKEIDVAKKELLLCSLVVRALSNNNISVDEAILRVSYCGVKHIEKIDRINDKDYVIPGLF